MGVCIVYILNIILNCLKFVRVNTYIKIVSKMQIIQMIELNIKKRNMN